MNTNDLNAPVRLDPLFQTHYECLDPGTRRIGIDGEFPSNLIRDIFRELEEIIHGIDDLEKSPVIRELLGVQPRIHEIRPIRRAKN
ncbi:MAG: hypothetical protein RBG13Loki_1707 [Promethearchaeota archaeon CR_4]|nr:MAG: hypothetical protein RBG13Loki_1707 [Candidatus Lokiarchaeota archaeon CR_4]